MTAGAQLSPVTMATIDMLRRTGMAIFELRYSEPEPDEGEGSSPLVWIAIAAYRTKNGRPRARGPINAHIIAAHQDPDQAIYELAEKVVDGGICQHCSRPTGFTADYSDDMPLDELICWYRFDPELKTFRRSCEGGQS